MLMTLMPTVLVQVRFCCNFKYNSKYNNQFITNSSAKLVSQALIDWERIANLYS